MVNSKPENCCLCNRQCALTFHHLIPRKVHRRTFYRKNFTREALAKGIFVCRQCHKGIHKLYDEMTLAKSLNTLELLQADTALAKHVLWVAKQKIARQQPAD
jgi:5-methylcytosine-specific restriction endonuclease McrA